MSITLHADKETVRQLAKQLLSACDGPAPLRLDNRETALVLAGLRLLQHVWINGGMVIPAAIEDILLDDDGLDHHTVEDIDRLCEKINTAP